MKKRNVIIAAALTSIMLVTGCQQNKSAETTTVPTTTAESTTTATETEALTTTESTTSVTKTEASITEIEDTPDDTFNISGKTFTSLTQDADGNYTVQDSYYIFNEDGSGSIESVDGMGGVPISWAQDGIDLEISLGSPDEVTHLRLSTDDDGGLYLTAEDSPVTMKLIEIELNDEDDSGDAVMVDTDYTPLAPPEESEGEIEYALQNAADAVSTIMQTGRYTCDINMVFEGNSQTGEMPMYTAADQTLGTYVKASMFGIITEGIYKPDGTAILLDADTKTFVNTTMEEAGASVSSDPTATMNITNEPLTKADVVTWNGKKCYRFYVTPEMMTSQSTSDYYIYVDSETGLMCGMYTEQMGTKTTTYITISGDVDASKFEVPADYTETTLEDYRAQMSTKMSALFSAGSTSAE